jgi:hypothetical protein
VNGMMLGHRMGAGTKAQMASPTSMIGVKTGLGTGLSQHGRPLST